jgi:hypothetical protein
VTKAWRDAIEEEVSKARMEESNGDITLKIQFKKGRIVRVVLQPIQKEFDHGEAPAHTFRRS